MAKAARESFLAYVKGIDNRTVLLRIAATTEVRLWLCLVLSTHERSFLSMHALFDD